MRRSESFSFTDFFQIVVTRFRFITAFIIAGFTISLVVPFILPEEYTSTCTILPSGGNKAGKLSAALNMMNINMPSEINSESSALFPAILESRRIREDLLRSKVRIEGEDETLEDILGGDTVEESLEELDGIISISQDETNGIIKVSSTTGIPSLSRSISENMVTLLREFNREKRRTKAWHNYRFISSGLERARNEMELAEERLAAFEDKHRHYRESTNPQVLMEHQRLERRLKIRTEVFIDMARELEIASIELKRKAPIVKVLDPAETPTLKSGPARKVIAALGAVLTLFLALMIPVSREIPLSVIVRKLFLEEAGDGKLPGEERTGLSEPSDTSSGRSDEKRYVRQETQETLP
jgi:uncharacterized protein involved in exopolysaccharide biosynthesis